jgi:putative transposase
MLRITKAVASEFPHHIIQRGNNKEDIFLDQEDRERYLSLFIKYIGCVSNYLI